jgi:uncharacterized membrane protein
MSSAELYARPPSHKVLNASLWLAQCLVFAGFTAIGLMKLLKPIPELAAMWPWTGQLPAGAVRSLGVIDIAGGVGVLFPALTRIKPGLTAVAALCAVALQLCAITFHILRGEIAVTPFNLVYLALAAFIFWGRRKQPILSR